MLDYKAIEALYVVVELQNFEQAAKRLHITQSAVSQRIKGLEDTYGEPLLVRTLPYRPTELGKQLIGHYKRIALLEIEFAQQLGELKQKLPISIAINRDSLETWFLDLMNEREVFKNITLEIVADDQEFTINHLKNGTVSACLSTSEKEIIGGRVEFVGNMEYLLVASPAFEKEFFPGGANRKSLRNAPIVKFDQNDKLQDRYLEKYFGINGAELKYNVIPSVRGFKKFVMLGYGYGLVPRIDIVDELKEGELVPIFADKSWDVPLYWHYWAIQSKFYQKFNTDIVELIRKNLTNQYGPSK